MRQLSFPFLRDLKSVKVISFIEIESAVGKGTKEDPVRIAKQYWDFDGNLIFVVDATELNFGLEEK